MARFLADSDDVLGLASAGDIVFINKSGGERKSFVEAPAETGKYSQTYIKSVRPYEEYVNEYELRSSSLELVFGAAINTDYFLFSANVTMSNEAYVRVSVTFRKYSSAALFDDTNSPDETVTVTGGFGVVDTLGCTVTGCAQSATYSIGGEETATLHATSGDFCAGGVMLHRLKKTCTLETTGTITLWPAGANKTQPLDVRGDNSGELHISSTAFFLYLDPA